ncbi:hypothetical protein ACFWNL_38925 [Kitasatospora sp. NPDC058397]|uniref:hypothetical protein n=1 Tax=unclassified Kitasatospora TaxID=2633591 RepID=UPI0036582938
MTLFANFSPAATWSALAEPDEAMVHDSRHLTTRSSTALTECGVGWDVVVVAPLHRGLAALDTLGVPLNAGLPVLADYARSELAVLVEPGTGRTVADVPGVRILARGSWLLIPVRGRGVLAAAWLSGPSAGGYVEAAALRGALLYPDAKLVEPGRAGQRATLGLAAPSSNPAH